MTQAGRQIDPSQHRVEDTEFARYLRKETGCKDLFTCWFRLTKKWSVCLWRNGSRSRFTELAALGDFPVGTRETVFKVKVSVPGNSLGEKNRAEIRRHMLSTGQAANQQDIEDEMEEMDADKFLRGWASRHKARRYLTVPSMYAGR